MSDSESRSKSNYSLIVKQLNQDFSNSTEKIVKDFYQNMPSEYFDLVSPQAQLDHLKTIIASKTLNIPENDFLLKDKQDQYTFISNDNRPGQLEEFIKQLPKDKLISTANIFTSSDNQFVVDVFSLAEIEKTKVPDQAIIKRLANTESVEIELKKLADNLYEINIIVDNADTNSILKKIVKYFSKRKIDIRQVSLGNYNSKKYSIATIKIQAQSEKICSRLEKHIRDLIYLDKKVLDLSYNHNFDFVFSEFFILICNLIYHQVSDLDRRQFSYDFVQKTLLKYNSDLEQLIKSIINQQAIRIDQKLYQLSTKSEEREILNCFLLLLQSIDTSNLKNKDRTCLAVAIRPEFFLVGPLKFEDVFLVYYALGDTFQGYHIRFSNIARGGLRILKPHNLETYTYQNQRLFEEAYSLAKAQHLKNKDIPEGGSKAIVIVEPDQNHEKAGRCFLDGLLDLNLANYPEKSELIYLGPDENVSDNLINWAISRAELKQHPSPALFMSSKPGAGINHKRYGITSEGIVVYVEQALKFIGINPRQHEFSVKLTGGTDGDVAGNLVKILIREFRTNIKFLGIADGTAALEDPKGLNQQELLRLVEENLAIENFSKTKLSSEGKLQSIKTEEGLKARNSLHSRIIADVFVPAGGRPKTINSHNYQDYFTLEGVASSKIIVEGANLFLSENSRKLLSEKEILIFKDSSANKCGVICSSFEILAGMLFSPEEFIEVKQEFVEQVIQKLKLFAELEAKILLRTVQFNPNVKLPEASERLSKVINYVSYTLQSKLKSNDSIYQDLPIIFKYYIPQLIFDKLGKDRVSNTYFTKLLATILTCKIVYFEGIELFENLEAAKILEVLERYLAQELKIQNLVDDIYNDKFDQKNDILDLLIAGGAATAFRMQ